MAQPNEPDPIRQAFLYAFPNPNRVGCPGDDIVRALAYQKLSIDHPAREHLSECSPCFRQFLEYQAEWKQKRRTRVLLASAAVVALAVFLGWFWKRQIYPPRGEVAVNHVPNLVDLSDDSNRGFNKTLTQPILSRSARDVTFIVKSRNQPGDYGVELQRSSDNQLVLRFTGTVLADQAGRKILQAQVNLSQVSPGPYLMLWYRHGSITKDVHELIIQ